MCLVSNAACTIENNVKYRAHKCNSSFGGCFSKFSRSLAVPAVLLALALMGQQAHAAGGTWKSASASFASTSAWSTNAAPTASTSGTINNGGKATLASGVTGVALNLTVGEDMKGTLSITGGSLTDTTSVLGDSSTGSGTATISTGSWGSTSSLIIGNSGTGVLDMTNSSGSVNVGSGTGALQLGANAGSTGTLNFTAGKLQVASVNGGAGTGIVNFLDTTNTTFAPQLTGSLAVTFNNSDHSNVTTLTGSSNYTGSTTITSFATVTVSGGQLHNDVNSTLIVGAADNDFATLNITNNGYVSGSNVVIGNTAGADGFVFIGSGAPSSSGTLNVTGTILVGTGSQSSDSTSGSGSITMFAGSVFTIDSGTGALVLGGPGDGVDPFSGGQGTLNYHGGTLNFSTVTTGGSNSFGVVNIYTNSFAPQIIGGTDANIEVAYLSGGTFAYSGSDNYSGNTGVGNGTTLEFTGGSFSLNNSDGPQVYIGEQSNDTGTVIITNNATVRASYLEVGGGVGSSGTLIMNSGTLITDVDFTVGDQGAGVFNMTGGTVESNGVSIAGFNTGSGTATISGGTWNDSEVFSVGNDGTGVLNIQGGTVNEAGTFYIALTSGATGTVNVSSGTLSVDSFVVGNSGTGTLNVTGGFVTGTDPGSNTYVGSNDASEDGQGVGTINVSSGTFSVAGPMYIALGGSGALNVTGGYVSTAFVEIGYYGDQGAGPAIGTAMVSSGTWDSNNNIVVGEDGQGTLNISGGLLTVEGGLGTIYLGDSGDGTGVLNFSGGTINAAIVEAGFGSATVNFTTTTSSTFAPQLRGDFGPLTVNQTGPGDTVLTGNSSFTGTTTISAGTLTVNGSLMDTTTIVGTGTLNGSGTTSNVTVNNGGVLGGTLNSGAVTVTAGGKVTAGDAPGANTMTSLTLTGSATYQEQIVVPGGGSYTGPGNHPIAGVDYGQTTLTGSGSGQTVVSLDSTSAILQLNVTGPLPAGGLATTGNPYTPGASNSSLDNYFILHLSDGTDTSTGRFAEVTLDGVNFVTIDYSATNLVGGDGVGTFTVGGQGWAISYTGDEADNSTIGGDDVVLTAIPEPGSYMLFAFGMVGLILLERRRKRSF